MPSPKKQIVFLGFAVCLLLAQNHAQGQGLIKTMLEQLAKLEAQLAELKRGYDIVKKGTDLIGDIKNGQFNLHKDYFSSLQKVNPIIKKSTQVTEIIQMQVYIATTCTKLKSQLAATGNFNASQLTHVGKVLENLHSLLTKDMDEVIAILSDANWQMTDDQRLARINSLYQSVSDKFTFIQAFRNQSALHGQRRAIELKSYDNISKSIIPWKGFQYDCSSSYYL